MQDVQWVPKSHTLTWSQSSSGKTTILVKPEAEAPCDLTGSFNPSGGVGYGGGEYTNGRDGIIFADKDGRLYRRAFGAGSPQAITPAFGQCASPIVSPDGKWVAFVHTFEGQDVLGMVDTEGKNWPKKIASGADFYMQPVWSPKGNAMAWVEWNHPNMPWDGTRLMFALLAGDPPFAIETHQLDGGMETPAFQPEFSPDGRYLSYLRGEGEWDQLVVLDLQTAERHKLVSDTVLIKPAWVQGIRVYAWAPNSESIYYIENQQASNSLKQVELLSGKIITHDLSPYTNLSQLAISSDGCLAMIAQSSAIPPRLITWKDGKTQIIARSQAESLSADDLPQPMPIEWTSSEGGQVFGIYYPPTNSHYTADGLPPAVVYIHGGPTSQTMIGYDLDAAYFTSRGYGYLVVNYRGSTGYGRSYHDRPTPTLGGGRYNGCCRGS